MLDDDRLVSLLALAADAFEVPASGPADVVRRAAAGEERPDEGPGSEGSGRVRRLAAAAGRHRVVVAAACLVAAVVLAGTIGVLTRGSTAPTLPAGAGPGVGHAARTLPAPAPAPTTSVPNQAAGGSTTQQKSAEAAPFSANGGRPAAGGPSVTTPSSPSAPALPNDAVGQSAKIEQTGTLGLSVGRGRLNATMTRLTALAGASGGFVANSQTQSGSGTGGRPTGTITLQVPVDSFSSVLKQAETMGATSDVTTRAIDVTGQYVDLQARIAALESSRQQYLTILSKATTVGDVLAVQEQLDGIQSQIEQLQGQLQVLTGQTSYSTLTVTVSEGTRPRPGPVPTSGLVRAWHDSIGGFVAGVEGLVRVAGPLLFALLCLAVVLVGGRALWRRAQRHRL